MPLGLAVAWLEFGRFLYEQRAYDEAASLVEEANRCGAAGYGGFYYLAQILYAAKRLDEAAVAAEQAREMQPTRPGVIDLSANIARKLGLIDEAIAFAETHLALEPKSEASRQRLENLQAQARSSKPKSFLRPVASAGGRKRV